MGKIVYIGNAVGDENGKASGGEAGDQNGKEAKIQPWYSNKKGWVVLRPRDPQIAEKLAYDMQAACDNKMIGYDQKERNTLQEIARKYNYDCAKVDIPCECDCSALVRVCCWYAGIKVGHFNTAGEVDALMKTGKFEKLTDAKYTEQSEYLKKGDILVTKVKGHTAIVLNDGDKASKTAPIVDQPAKPSPAEPKPSIVKIKIKGLVRVRNGNGTLNRTLAIVGQRGKVTYLPYLGQAPESPYWYMTRVDGIDGYITSKPKYTELVEGGDE